MHKNCYKHNTNYIGGQGITCNIVHSGLHILQQPCTMNPNRIQIGTTIEITFGMGVERDNHFQADEWLSSFTITYNFGSKRAKTFKEQGNIIRISDLCSSHLKM